jgi:phage terminase large subunit
VFRNWRVEECPAPPDGTRFYFGADWGFAVDPTVLVRCWADPDEPRRLYVDREAWRIGCEIDDTPALFDVVEDGQARRWPVCADSARPETISFMVRHGYPKMFGAKKGAGSVEDGIEFLKSFEIVVDPRCANVADELACYRYRVDDRTDEVLPVLEDKKNHTIDALRYAVEARRRRSPNLIVMPGGVEQESRNRI